MIISTQDVGSGAVALVISSGLPTAVAGCDLRSDHVRFVVDTVALGSVSSEYFELPSQFSFN
jgi:hypothetical protein